MSIFGELEELAGDLYPYRVPIALGLLLVVAAVVAVGYRRGWHRTVARHGRASVVVAVVALAVLAPLGYYTLSPLWSRSELVEASPIEAATAGQVAGAPAGMPRVLSAGEVRGADEFHFGEGRAQLIETAPGRYTLRFEEFSVRNGPDLFVYLSPDAEGYAEGALNLGELKATDGAFNYDVPPGTDVAAFRSAIVWCRQFTVLFATAPLVPA